MASLAQSIDSFLRARHSPLAGYGQALVNAAVTAGHRYRVDPGYLAKLIVGISGSEQSYGTSGAPDVALRNLWGWGHPPDASHGMGFASYPQAVQTLAEGLAKGYLSQGLVSPEQIAPKYVGSGDHTGWINTVRSTISQLGGQVPPGTAVPASAVQPSARVLPGTRAQAPNPGRALALSLINSTNRLVGLPGLSPLLFASLASQAAPKAPSFQTGALPPTKAGTVPTSRPSQGKAAKAGYPLGRQGPVIGTPYSGTHTLGNWQSDNAIDIAVPVGTPVYATEDGTIGSRIGSLGEGGRFAGLRLTLEGGDNQFYYAHLSRLNVRAGEKVRKGQLLGYSGSANGVAHLHIGILHGDPRNVLL